MDMAQYLIVGVDPAKADHGFWAMKYPEERLSSGKVRNDLPDLEVWDKRLEAMARRRKLQLVYAVEGTGGYGERLVRFLLSQGRVVKEINALKVNRQRDFYGEDKSDLLDARTAAVVGLRQMSELPSVESGSDVYRQIREVSRYLAHVMRSHRQALNRLHGQLMRIWPVNHAGWFSRLNLQSPLQFYARYPHPSDLAGVSAKELEEFFRKASGRRLGRGKAEEILRDCEAYRDRPPSPQDRIIALMVRTLAESLLQGLKTQKEMEKVLQEDLLPQTGQKLQTLKGVAIQNEAVILGEMLSPDRFRDRNAFAKYSGTAARDDSTGQTQRWKAQKACNRRLKAAFYRVALVNATWDPLGRAYLQSLIQRGLSKNEAYKRLARRLCDILFAMIRTKSAYDPERVKQSIEARQKKGRGGTLQKTDLLRAQRSSNALPRPIRIVEPRQGGLQQESD